jgi:hypothetical protein
MLEDRLVPANLIPVSGHRDLVYDGYRNVLDITASNGTLQQFNVMTQTLMPSTPLGASLTGADISADGNYLLVADQQAVNGQEVLHRINLSNGARTDFYYPSIPGEGGWSLALGPSTKGLLDDIAQNNGPGPLRQFDAVTGARTFRNDSPGSAGGGVGSGTVIQRSADRSLFLITEGTTSYGNFFTYSPQTDTFSHPYAMGTPLTNALTAVNRNGTLFAIEVNGTTTVFDSNFNVRRTLPGLDGGLVFDPSQDLLWGVTSQNSQLVAYDTNNWTMRFQAPVGEATPRGTPMGNGMMAMSTDGRWVFLATPSGVREFPSPFAPGPVAYLSVGNVPATATAGSPFALTVSALDSSGRVSTGYVGTVHFTSTDPRAVLPADYTFTPTDLGTHTFSISLGTAGGQTLNVYDPRGPGAPPTPPITVVPGAVASFQLTPSGLSNPQAAGYSFGLTVTPTDAYGNVAYNYTGTVHFTSTDAAALLPRDYTFTSKDNGRHGFSLTLNTAGSQTVTVGDATKSARSSLAVNVANYIPGLHFTLGPSTTTPTAGTPLSLTVTAWDQYNSVATRYVGTVTFTTSDHGTGAQVPADYTFTSADRGVHTFPNGIQVVTAGSQTVGIGDKAYGTSAGGSGNAGTGGTMTSTKFTVSPAAASTFRLGGLPATVTAGGSGTVSLTAYDAYGNVATGYVGTVHFTSSDAQAALPADATLTNGTGTFSVVLATAGTQSVTATDTANAALTSTQGGITVTPAAASVIQVTAFPSSVTAGDVGTFAVTAYDAYGNVATGYAGTVHFTSSDAQAVLPADATLTNGTGTFTAALRTAGGQSLTATDTANAGLSGSEGGVTVNAAAATMLVLSAPTTATAGVSVTVTVTAYDAYGNVATGYLGTVSFSSSDASAGLPADYTFTAADAGTGTFSVTFATLGSQNLTASDTANGLSMTLGVVVQAA